MCVCVCMYVCMYVCIYTYTYIHIYIYIYIHVMFYALYIFEIWGSRALLMRCLFKFDGIHASIEWDFGGIDYWILRGF